MSDNNIFHTFPCGKVFFVALSVFSIATQVFSQEYLNALASTRFRLSAPVDRILPGPNNGVLVIDRKNTISLVDVETGLTRASTSFPSAPLSLTPFRDSHGFWHLAALSRASEAPSRFRLDTLDINEGFHTQTSYEDAAPLGSQDPRARPIFGDNLGGATVVWDHAPQSGLTYRVTKRNGVTDIIAKQYPYELLNVSSDQYMLALHPSENGVSLLNLEGGYPEDQVYLEGLSFSDPAHLAVFVPDDASGGTGEVVIANSDTQLLTVLSVETHRLPRIASPIQIAIKDMHGGASDDGQLLVAADRDLTVIAVGVRGSNRLRVFRRIRSSGSDLLNERKIGGGLEETTPIILERPIRDMTVTNSQRPLSSGAFVFLTYDGGSLTVVPDLSKLRTRTESDREPPRKEISSNGSAPADISRLQRVLAALGYSVGAVDGNFGPTTAAAVRAFQIDNNIEASATIDEKTAEALNVRVSRIAKQGAAPALEIEAYRSFLSSKVPGMNADRLVTLGVSHGNPDSPCFGQNSLPPRDVWENSVGFARVLRYLEQEKGFRINIVSGYRSLTYGRCSSGGDVGANHVKFQGFDIRVADTKDLDDGARRLLKTLREMRSAGVFSGGVGMSGRSVHVDTRGTNVDCGPC
ncbi:M15 family metallopeptidase [Ensifer sp. Root278]|uniref:M15 family metallopeptidase n=1 Tax=Ensifer sp. Root278 TaxID=1736509 RepID=UPI0009E98758|nr:M15 family metallopeptidase [Ensifer sp. Root278]